MTYALMTARIEKWVSTFIQADDALTFFVDCFIVIKDFDFIWFETFLIYIRPKYKVALMSKLDFLDIT
jgi:hypothetical protein